MVKLPCPVSLQNATRSIAVIHGTLVLITAGYFMYTLGGLINSKEVSHVHSAKGLVSTFNEYYAKLGLAKPKSVAKMGEKVAKISLGKDSTADKILDTGSKVEFYSSKYVDDLKVQQEIALLLLALIILLLIFLLDVELFQGANEKTYARINTWYRTMFTLAITGLTVAVPVVVAAVDYEFTWKFYAVGATKVLAFGYVLCIVNSFKEQIKSGGGGGRASTGGGGMKTRSSVKKSE